MTLKDNKRKLYFLIDMSVLSDNNQPVKEYNEIDKYNDVETEIERNKKP